MTALQMSVPLQEGGKVGAGRMGWDGMGGCQLNEEKRMAVGLKYSYLHICTQLIYSTYLTLLL